MLDPGDFLAIDRPSGTKERPADTDPPASWQLTWVRISETDKSTWGRISETSAFRQADRSYKRGMARSETGHSVAGGVASNPARFTAAIQVGRNSFRPRHLADTVNSSKSSVQPSGSARVGRQDRTEKRGGCLQKPQGSVGIPVIEFALDIRSCR